MPAAKAGMLCLIAIKYNSNKQTFAQEPLEDPKNSFSITLRSWNLLILNSIKQSVSAVALFYMQFITLWQTQSIIPVMRHVADIS